MSNQKKCFIEEFDKNLYFNEKLSKYSWFNIGGKAKILFKPDSEKQLEAFLKKNDEKITIIGAGSNTLIRDGGIKGVTIKLSAKFSYLELINDNIIKVGAATLDKKFSNFAAENSLSGFEFLSCIPGSIAGGIRMNCGCYGHEISENLISIMTINSAGNKKEILKKDINFFYRGSDLDKNLIILSAKFKGKAGNKNSITKKQLELLGNKKKTQPTQVKTSGSTFKNPKNKKAWKLIQESGCIGMKIGDAQISDKHCNFFINNGKAKSEDLEKLILQVKDKVFKKTGVKLELEVQIIGKTL